MIQDTKSMQTGKKQHIANRQYVLQVQQELQQIDVIFFNKVY